ncbi:MAG TPA: hypothetical protein VLL52_12730 [Anaerolineae bacterium]|nr:hypothetical protein [Anaerolineae bacterium]
MNHKLIILLIITTLGLISCSSRINDGTTAIRPIEPLKQPPSDADQLLLTLPRPVWEAQFPHLTGEDNLFWVDLDGDNLQPWLSGINGYNYIIDVPHRDHILVAAYDQAPSVKPDLIGELYLLDRDQTDMIKITDQFPNPLFPATIWQEEEETVNYIGLTADGPHFFSWSVAEKTAVQISTPPMFAGGSPLWLAAGTDNSWLYWKTGQIGANQIQIGDGFWRLHRDQARVQQIHETDKNLQREASVSPQGTYIIFGNTVQNENLEFVTTLPLVGEPAAYFWSDDGQELLIKTCEELCLPDQRHYFIWSTRARTLSTLAWDVDVVWALWSPQRHQILLGTESDQSGFQFQLWDRHTLDLTPALSALPSEALLPTAVQWWPK